MLWEEENYLSKGRGKKSIHFNGSEETVEINFRSAIFVNQLSIYGAVADVCNELAPDSRKQAEGEVWGSMVVPTEFPNANAISQTDSSAQANLLREDEQKLAELPDDQKLSKLCSDAGFLKGIGKGQLILYYT